MTRLLGILVLVALVVGGIGYYRGWFTVAKEGDTFNVTVDTKKIEADKKKMEDAVKEKVSH